MVLMRENGSSEVRNWELMKRLMTRHFIPPDVRDKFYLKLQEKECQFKVLPPKEIFEDLSQQIEEFQSSMGRLWGGKLMKLRGK